MPSFERSWGALELSAWAARPSVHRASLGASLYTDGITAGIEGSLLWVGGYLAWAWNHANCPECRQPDDEQDEAPPATAVR